MGPLKCLLLPLLAVVMTPLLAHGQSAFLAPVERLSSTGRQTIPGSHLLQQENKKVLNYVRSHPGSLSRPALLNPFQWNFDVGATHTWKAWTFDTGVFYDVPSTCRGKGDHCWIFVADDLWGTKVTQAAVDAVEWSFESDWLNSRVGIYEKDVNAFGEPPDIDGDPRIIILILDIKDGFSGQGAYVAGYFFSGDEAIGYPGGNNADILYVDADPVDLAQEWGISEARSVVAHEFQHMIHFRYDPDELSFVNEGCSCFAEMICGYPIAEQSGYLNETNHYLLDWRPLAEQINLSDYGRAARFMKYIGDQIGEGVFRHIVSSKLHGIEGLEAALDVFGANRGFGEIFPDWELANALDDRNADPHLGYAYPSSSSPRLPQPAGEVHFIPTVPLTADTVCPLAAQFHTFPAGSDLRITFTTSSPDLIVKAVEYGSTSRRLRDVTPGVQFREIGFGETYWKIVFVVINTSRTDSAAYSYQSNGTGSNTATLQYENAEPTGYLGLQSGDTSCVWFDGIPGTRLDGIAVGLHTPGNIVGSIYRFTGSFQTSPLGARIGIPFVATRAPVTSPWAYVDLKSRNIDTGAPFAVAFPCIGSPTTNPRVTIVQQLYNPGDIFHSVSFCQEASPRGWYLIFNSSSPNYIYAYSIRAIVSYPSTDVKDPEWTVPIASQLMQNYPNPFNPLTVIRYTVGGAGEAGAGGGEPGTRSSGLGIRNTRLVVYDVLGREVATLVNEPKAPGNYEVSFSANGLASGIYYYRLTVGSIVETRAMMLLK